MSYVHVCLTEIQEDHQPQVAPQEARKFDPRVAARTLHQWHHVVSRPGDLNADVQSIPGPSAGVHEALISTRKI